MTQFASEPHSTVGARVAAARRNRGMTQRDLAEALGVTSWTVDRIESGRADVGRYLSSIADVTQTSRDWFVGSTQGRAEGRMSDAVLPHLGVAGRNLVLSSIVLLVTIRFFTEVVPVLPRAAGFIDIPIFLVAIGAVAYMQPVRTGPWYLRTAPLVSGFLLLSLVSVVVNIGRVAPGPVLVFLYGFLAPIAIYAIVYRVWPPGNAAALRRTLVGLALVQLAVVVFIDLRTFLSTHNPDDISGTFGTNAYQLVFFLLVVVTLVVGVATFEPGTQTARIAVPLVGACFIVMLLAQYRALLVSMVVAVLAVAYLVKGTTRGTVAVGVMAVGFALAFYYAAVHMPFLKLDSAAVSIAVPLAPMPRVA